MLGSLLAVIGISVVILMIFSTPMINNSTSLTGFVVKEVQNLSVIQTQVSDENNSLVTKDLITGNVVFRGEEKKVREDKGRGENKFQESISNSAFFNVSVNVIG